MEPHLFMPLEPSSVNAVLLWGLELIRAVQRVKSPGLTSAMILAGNLGGIILILVTAAFFWCVDEKRGVRLGIIMIITTWVNVILKTFLQQPRPFVLDPSVELAYSSGFGLPSGHAQISLTLIVILAYWAGNKYSGKKPLILLVSLFLILLAGFNRIYLGVHFPTDLAGGWLVGGVILCLFFPGEKIITRLLDTGGKRRQLIIAAMAALFMKFVYPGDSGLPALLLGAAGGYALLINSVSFSAGKIPDGKVPAFLIFGLRCLLGIAGTAIIFFGLKMVFPGGDSVFGQVSWWGRSSPYIELGQFVRYGLTGLWISAGAPLLFGNLNLAANKMKDTNRSEN